MILMRFMEPVSFSWNLIWYLFCLSGPCCSFDSSCHELRGSHVTQMMSKIGNQTFLKVQTSVLKEHSWNFILNKVIHTEKSWKEIIGITLKEKKDSKHVKGVTISTGCILKTLNISPGRSEMIWWKLVFDHSYTW